MTPQEFQAKLKAKGGLSWFLFCGEEEYMKHKALLDLRRAVIGEDAFAALNHLKFEGEELDFDRLREALSTPPMMAETKLIEWHLCHFDKMKEEAFSRFLTLCEEKDLYEGTVLLFYVEEERLSRGTDKRPEKRFSAIARAIDTVVFSRPTDPQLLGWIDRHMKEEGLRISSDTARLILERCGRRMQTLSGEIDKIAAFLHQKGRDLVTAEDVLFVSAVTVESEPFSLSNAILSGNAHEAYLQLKEAKNAKTDPSLLFGSVFRLFGDLLTVATLRDEGLAPSAIAKLTGLHEYRVGLYLKSASGKSVSFLDGILEKCRRLDLSAKKGNADFQALERLIAAALSR